MIDIVDSIAYLRKHRQNFYIQTNEEAYQSAVALVDKLFPLRAAQLGSDAFHLDLYKPDPNAADQKAEEKKRLDSALLAKLATPVRNSDFGIGPTEPYNKEKAIEGVAAEMRGLAKTGLYSRERAISTALEKATGKAPPKPISDQTLRYNRSLTAVRREKMFESGLEPPLYKMNAKRRKQKSAAPSTAPFVRGQKKWRAQQLVTACQHLRNVADWIRDNPHDEMISVYMDRYDFANLYVGQSQYAPADFPSRLAIAIASADDSENGTDQHVSNDRLARMVSKLYGLYAFAIQSSRNTQSGRNSISEIFKSLI